MSNMRDRGSDERTETGHSRFRGKPTGKRSGRGRGGKTNAANLGMPAGGREETTNSVRLRPTHFIALPLINHPSLMAHIKDFQRGLFSDVDGLNDSESNRGKGWKVVESSLVKGLDSSILIDPRRLHMTLGVMALEQDDESLKKLTQGPTMTIPSISLPTNPSLLTQSQPFLSPASAPTTPLGAKPEKTVSTALYLLHSLKPRISEILNCDKGIKIPLEVMHVLKTQNMCTNTKGTNGGDANEEKEVIGAGVLYVAPEMKNQSVNADLRKLIQVSDFVHQAFKDAGYITETRPLKLHCTILNTSHRKSRFRQPFSYSDILVSDALRVLQGKEKGSSAISSMSALQPVISSSNTSSKPSNVPVKSQAHSVVQNPPSVSVDLGVVVVEEIQLWVMGSHGPNNEYINCGGVILE